MDSCIFCKIIEGEIPSVKVYEDDKIIAFNDIHPAAPVHVLIVPKRHVANILELAAEHQAESILQSVLQVIPIIAEKTGVAANGFRLINNCGREGGQTIDHLHFHLIGGRDLGEKLL